MYILSYILLKSKCDRLNCILPARQDIGYKAGLRKKSVKNEIF